MDVSTTTTVNQGTSSKEPKCYACGSHCNEDVRAARSKGPVAILKLVVKPGSSRDKNAPDSRSVPREIKLGGGGVRGCTFKGEDGQLLVSLGRDAARNTIFIDSPRHHNMISRRHATLHEYECGEGWRCEIHGSPSNGIAVNGKKIHEAVLEDGDLIYLGGIPPATQVGTVLAPKDIDTDLVYRYEELKYKKKENNTPNNNNIVVGNKMAAKGTTAAAAAAAEVDNSVIFLDDDASGGTGSGSVASKRTTAPAAPGAAVAAASSVTPGINFDGILKEFECIICYDLMVHTHKMANCAHSFCGGCIKSWLKEKKSCPICNAVQRQAPTHNIAMDNTLDSLVTNVPGLAQDERVVEWKARREAAQADISAANAASNAKKKGGRAKKRGAHENTGNHHGNHSRRAAPPQRAQPAPSDAALAAAREGFRQQMQARLSRIFQ